MFTVGQKVKCKEYFIGMAAGTVFVVRSIFQDEDHGDFVRLNTLGGEEIHGAYYATRFEAAR